MGSRPSLREKGERNAEATRSALVDAAAELFAARGFDGVSLDEVAREARVNKAMVSYHFGGKEALYQAILHGDIDPTADALVALAPLDLPADEKLRRFIAIFGGLHSRRPNLSRLVMRELLSAGMHLDEALAPRFQAVFQTLHEIIAQGIREGVFRPVDPLLTHQTITGALVFFFAVAPFRDRLLRTGRIPGAAAPDPEAYIAHVQTLVIRGLAPEESRHD